MNDDDLAVAYQKAREELFSKISRGQIALDGMMSPLTRELVDRFGAEGVDMTLAWAWTPMDWLCPACGRAKADIVRLNSKRQLMCRLVEHHDHMKDLVEREFKLACQSQDVLIADEQAQRFAARASQMVSAYDNTIICDDCNGADAIAKGQAKTHKSFSYSPQEIRQFVRPRPNEQHRIHVEDACRIWHENSDTFERRLKIISQIATIAATDSHWYQELPRPQTAESIYKYAKFFANNSGVTSALYELAGDRSQPLPDDLSRWRRVVQPAPTSPPSNKDIEYVAKVISAKFWDRVPDGWQCVVCAKPKRETVRKSKRDWTFLLSDRSFYAPGERRETRRAVVCAECGALATSLGKEASQIAGIKSDQDYGRYLMIPELCSVVKPQAYGRHNVNNELADRLMELLVVRVRVLNNVSSG